MTRSDVRTLPALLQYARGRAKRSLDRNDPIAYAYWTETESFFRGCLSRYKNPSTWREAATACASRARETGAPMEAALWYSRAKWFVILGRNIGLSMSPKETVVNLDWLRRREIERRAS